MTGVKEGKFVEYAYIDNIIKKELEKIKERVLTKDRDYVAVYDGEEGVGKSVLAMQHAKQLDPEFCLDNVVFTADDFIKKIRDVKTKKGACIVLDEGFNAANSRAALTQVNRSMIALATEMRQKNLFVLIVLPSFFDLDKYFALWRCRALFHVYFTPEEDRHYIVFDKVAKKLLFLNGKKTYDYNYPKSPFPPCKFFNEYVLDEKEYRKKKAEAFKKRTVSNQARNWLLQRNALIKQLIKGHRYGQTELNEVMKRHNVEALSQQSISFILQEIAGDTDKDVIESLADEPLTDQINPISLGK